jgi:hypothetical protein
LHAGRVWNGNDANTVTGTGTRQSRVVQSRSLIPVRPIAEDGQTNENPFQRQRPKSRVIPKHILCILIYLYIYTVVLYKFSCPRIMVMNSKKSCTTQYVGKLLALISAFVVVVSAFTPVQQKQPPRTVVARTSVSSTRLLTNSQVLPQSMLLLLPLYSSATPTPPDRNPNKPELPTIPGDFDWDNKYSGDADWLMGDAVPGKRVLNEIELASQVTALGALEEKWRRERLGQEYNDAIQIGWVPKAELANGRFAMFFLITGLLTEYWTGISIPGQVEELLRIAGVIGM